MQANHANAPALETAKKRRIKTSITIPDGLMEDPLLAVVMKRRYVGNFSELVTRLVVEDLERAKESTEAAEPAESMESVPLLEGQGS